MPPHPLPALRAFTLLAAALCALACTSAQARLIEKIIKVPVKVTNATPGVVATINFAGGGGGNPATQPQEPCAPNRLKRMFADYGRSARIPTLWVYTENDQWFGPKYPREWFDAFKAGGGVGEFVLFPPNGKDGHYLFTQDPEVWRPKAMAFLRANGYLDLKP